MFIPNMEEDEFIDYLEEFRCKKYFCAIKVGGECLDNFFEDSILRLYNIGLIPLVLHGGGKQIDDALEKEKISVKKLDGKRYTDKKLC